MKTLSISSAVILLAASLCAIGSPAAETLPPDLAKRASSVPPALKSQIGHSNTFYRAVDESEATAEGISTRYPLGGHPSSLLDVSGDFSAHEALYVTHVRRAGQKHKTINLTVCMVTIYFLLYRIYIRPSFGGTALKDLTGT